MIRNRIYLKDEKRIHKYLHPIRTEISHILAEKDIPMTVKMIAEEIGLPHGKTHYHVKVLDELGLLKVVKTTRKNGIISKYYKRKYESIFIHPEFDKTTIPQLALIQKNSFVRLLNEYIKDVVPETIQSENLKKEEDYIIHVEEFMFEPDQVKAMKKELIGIVEKYHSTSPKAKHYKVVLTTAPLIKPKK